MLNYKIPLMSFACSMILVGCGGSNQNETSVAGSTNVPTITISNLPDSNANVAIGDEAQLNVGQYFIGVDGSKLLIINSDQELASAIYVANTSGKWRRFPEADIGSSLQITQSSALNAAAIELAQAEGDYVTHVAGSTVQIILSKDGKITTRNATGCKISGDVGANYAVGVRKVDLRTSNCNGLAAELSGYLIADRDYEPMKWRVVAENDKQIAEIWLAAE